MSKTVNAVIRFMDETFMNLAWPQQGGDDPVSLISNVRKALELDRLVVEVEGDLFVIPIRNVKYVQITPAPSKLPGEVIRGGQIA